MNLHRAPHSPQELLEFYEEALTTLGALCERTWHDRLEVIAEGCAASLWNPDGTFHEVELRFAPADATSARDAAREVFPGCPLTFHLAEALRLTPMPLERFVLADTAPPRPPEPDVAEKLWRAQFPDTTRWQLATSFQAHFHFSLLALMRCEIQAIDQHWSLRRVSVSLPGGAPDHHLAREIGFSPPGNESAIGINWPTPDPARWNALLRQACEQELAEELACIRARQENSLSRELNRIDDYFENYEQELNNRVRRGSNKNAEGKIADRLAAARVEHARRRADQLARHEIRVLPHLDALLLVAERAWSASLCVQRARHLETVEGVFTPRSRRWSFESEQFSRGSLRGADQVRPLPSG
jgi:hypothetical protein